MKKFTREDYELCDKITTRAMEMDLYPSDHRITAMMDIQNAAKYSLCTIVSHKRYWKRGFCLGLSYGKRNG